MRYMTKEWYEAMQKTDICLHLNVSKEAEIFSERYFKELYKSEEKKWLELQESVSNVKFERLDFNNKLQFDPFDEKKKFKHTFHLKVNRLKKNLPDKILGKVADIRVLALNYASLEVKNDILEYCKNNEEKVKHAVEDYDKFFQKQFEKSIPNFISKLCLHDCTILSYRKKGKDMVMIIDNSDGSTKINKIIMRNCSVIKQDARLNGAWCLYEEIYKSGEKYEVHFLLKKNELIDFIILIDNLEYQYDE